MQRVLKRCPAAFVVTLVVLLLVAAALPQRAAAVTPAGSINRYNVVMVLDASGSMLDTDGGNLRTEAMSQFVYTLAAHGNNLGGVVFTHEIPKTFDLSAVDSFEDKRNVMETLTSVVPKADYDTNIGAALDRAVTMIKEKGDPNLPSVIVFLSDGNTDLKDDKEKERSLQTKADALLRAQDQKIRIYSVCLNANNSADVNEMRQLSKATGGEFREVKNAEDLQNVYEAFYGLIFGGSAETIAEEEFPEDGIIETEFDLPGIGVEEVNIIVYGKLKSYTLMRPDGGEAQTDSVTTDTFTLIKLTDVTSGTWKLVTEGVPGDKIRINKVFNTNLDVSAEIEPQEGAVNPKDPVVIRAYLSQGGHKASGKKHFTGYTAEVQVISVADESIVDTLPMKLSKDHFEVSQAIATEGNYKFKVHVTGNNLDRYSGEVGPIKVTTKEPTIEEKENTAPTPVKNPVEYEIYVWPAFSPIGDKELPIDLTKLATDKEDTTLTYSVISKGTTFLDDDYIVNGNQLTVKKFSIPKGVFIVRGMDGYGKFCDIKVVVTSHNVALIVAIVVCVVIAIVGIVLAVMGYKRAIIPFRGDVTIYSNVNGTRRGSTVPGRRGRIKLTAFGLDPINGINYRKAHVQATAKPYVWFKSNKPFMFAGKQTKKVRVDSGSKTIVYSLDESGFLELSFRTIMDPMPAGGIRGKGFKQPRKPKPLKPPRSPKVPKLGRR